MHIICSKPSL